jgi:hypothetical protein
MGKKNKKAKGDKLPKTIAGVKVPKDLRGAGGLLASLARDPAAREVALAALTAALAARKDNRKAARKLVAGEGEGAEKSSSASSWIRPALTAAAVEAGRMLVDAFDDRKAKPPSASDERRGADRPGEPKAPPGVTH